MSLIKRLKLFSSFGNLRLFQFILLLVIALIVATYFSVYRWNLKKDSSLDFWDLHEETQSADVRILKLGQPKWKPEFLGQVNMHIFDDWCGGSVAQLRKNELFPMFPHVRTTIRKLAVYPGWQNYGLRIFGYIHPSISGEYLFAIASDDNSEFWLSSDESIRCLKLMAFLGQAGNEWAAPGEYEKFASQISKPLQLSNRQRYYFEIIYKQSIAMDHVELAWRLNREESNFEIITSEFLSLYSDESSLKSADNKIIPQTAASQRLAPDPLWKADVDMVNEDPRDTIYKLQLLPNSYLDNVFPACDYYPIHIYEKDTIQRYSGINYVRYTSVYPNDYTRLATEDIMSQLCFYSKDEAYRRGRGFSPYLKFENTAENNAAHNKNKPNWRHVFNVKPVEFHSKQSDFVVQTCNKSGNIIMSQKEVTPIIKAFKTQLKSSEYTSELILKRVLNVEKKTKVNGGSRYFLEMEVENKEGRNFLISKYFYTTNVTLITELPELCIPKDFSWEPDKLIHIILAVKNQGRWFKLFLREMERIYEDTGDENFTVIIVDFSSTDLDVEQELKNAKLPSYLFRNLKGKFAKSYGVQAAIELVKDDNSILFLCDLHIHYPSVLLQNIRKHTIQGKMVYEPVVMRLDCGATLYSPSGFWEIDGYGLVGIYKSDIQRIGGMNVKEFAEKWGGEDWELLDRILLNKLEVERINLRNFAHFFHSKRGMWNRDD